MEKVEKLYKKFVINIFLLTFGLVGVGYIVFFKIKPEFFHPVMPYMLMYVLSVTLLSHRSMLKSLTKRPAVFVNTFMMFMGIKLLSYLAFIAIVAFINTTNIISFTFSFFGVYLVYTVFETVSILKSEKEFRYVSDDNKPQ
jgi:hypothetical protein